MNNRTRSILASVVALLLCFTQALAIDVFSPDVSVTYTGSNMIDGTIVSEPVSVTFTGSNIVDGTIVSDPVSVSYTDESLAGGTIVSDPVSVSLATTTGIDGSIASKPASVVLNQFLGFWSMDGDWQDSSGNGNHATASGNPVFDPNGKSASCGSFNGTGAYLDAGSAQVLRPIYAVSMEAWIRVGSGAAGRMFIAGNTDETGMTGYALEYNSGRILMRKGNGAWNAVTSSATITPGIWYHVAGTYDGSKIKLYLNGQLDNEAPATGIITYANSFRMGYRPGSSGAGYYSGLIDELAVFNRPLSATEIASHYTSGKLDITPPASPIINPVSSPTASSILSLSGTKEADSSIWVNSSRVVAIDSATTWLSAYNLNPGVNTLNITSVDASDNQSTPTIITVIYDNQPPYIAGSNPADRSETAAVVNNVTINLADLYSAIDLTATVAAATVKNVSSMSVAGTWATSGGSTVIFTPSGLLAPDTYTVTINPTDSLGNSGVQQIVFTNHDITSPVTSISLAGTLGSDGWYTTPVTATLTAIDSADGSGVAVTQYSSDQSTWTAYSGPIVVDKDGMTTLYYRSIDQAGNQETARSSVIKINKTGVLGLWHMDNDWLDSSVVGNNGTAYNDAGFSPDAKIGSHSGSFDGVNDYVAITESSSLNIPAGTWEFWVKIPAASTGNGYGIMAKADPTSSLNGITIYEHLGGIYFVVKSSSGVLINANGGAVADNQFHHVVAVFNKGVSYAFYVDGALKSSGPVGNFGFSGQPLRFGRTLDTYWQPFKGLIDEVTIYNRELSAEEVLAHYQTASIAPPTVDQVASPTATETVTFTGTKPANTSILLNGSEFYPLDGQTSWQGAYTLQSGANAINISSRDSSGNRSQSVTLNVIYDNGAPQVTGSNPANGAIVNTAVSSVALVIADAYSNVDLAALVSGATVRDSSGQDIPGSWSTSGTDTVIFTAASPLADGTYTVTVHPADTLGNAATTSISFTCDTQAPAMPGINPVVSPTNQQSQIVSGTRATDSTAIVVSSTTAVIGQISYPSAATWSVTVSGLVPGANSITAYAKDSAGNHSDVSTAVILYDITAPAALTVNTFVSPTKDLSITLSGTKEAGSYLYVNNSRTSAPSVDTTWSYAAALTIEGKNTISIFARDDAGNQSQSVSVDVIRDTTPPRLSSSSPVANSVTNQTGSIVITLADDYSLVDLAASIVGSTVKNASGVVVTGEWSASNGQVVFIPSAGFGDGSYMVTLYPADSLGNKGTVSFGFIMDTTPPVLQSFSMSPQSPVKAGSVSFTFVFNEAMATGVQPTVTFGRTSPFTDYTLTGGSWLDAKTWRASYLFSSATGDGSYTVRVSGAKDKALNVMAMQDAGSFVLVTALPVLPTVSQVTTPTRTSNQTLSGTKPANTGIAINGSQKVAPNASTTWTYLYPLSEGRNDLNITARDAAGNDSAAMAVSIILDTTPPIFTVDNFKSPSPSALQTISGKKEPGCIVKMNSVTIFDVTDQGAIWSYNITLTAGITNRFAFTASDAMGNTTSKTIDITYDISAPAALGPGVLVTDGKGRGTEVTLDWSLYVESADIAYYKIFMSSGNFSDSAGMTPVATTNRGVKTYKVTGLTQGSSYYFAVVPVDASGNLTTAVNAAMGVPSDTVAPEDVTITSVTAGYDGTNGNFITLRWTPAVNSSGDLADQIVYFDSGAGYDAGTSIGKTFSSYTKAGLNDASRYKFRITVKDTSGHESTGVHTEGVTRLGNPAALTVKPGNGKTTLSWNSVSGAVGGLGGQDSSTYVKQYNIYRTASETAQTGARSMQLVKSISPATLTYTDTGITNGTTYQYAVTTVNTFGAEKTDVSSVAAKPRMDETGPQITAFNISQGQIITVPVTVTASATDTESAMDRIELYVDNVLAKTQTGGGISFYWNVVDITGGNHTVGLKAFDQFGNVTEESRQVIVSLAPPAMPVITGHSMVQTSPHYLVNISGTAPLYTTVSLKVNGVVVAQTATTDTGAFSFSGVKLVEGDNLLSAKASHKGGDSPYSPDYKIPVDSGAPSPPVNLASQVLTGGPVRFTWSNGAGEIPFGYNLYVSNATFADKSAPGVSKANTSLIKYSLFEYTPGDDIKRYYAVTALDSSGNESGLSNVVAVSSDRTAPVVTSVDYNYTDINGVLTSQAQTAGPGSVKVSLAVSKVLRELPFFSLEPTEGTPIVVSMQKIDDTHYEGAFAVTGQSPQGATTYKFSGKDLTGNRGNAQGTGITIDVKGPVVSIQSPLSVLQSTAGVAQITIVFDEPSVTVPVLDLKALNGSTARITGFASSDSGIHWSGSLDPSSMPEGQAEFVLAEAKDKFGNTGSTVISGRYILIYRDSVPPPDVPQGLAAKSAKGGLVTLTWYPVEGATSYSIYRRAENDSSATKVISPVPGSPVQDTPPTDGVYYYSVSSSGLLQSESPRCAEVQGASDRMGPDAPLNLTLSLGGSGVNASWQAVSEEVKGYNLYRSDGPITSTTGLTPIAKAANAMAVDTAPTQSKRFYAVAAVDLLGNEGSLSDSKEIIFPVSPVRNLLLERLDNAAPVLSWQPPSEGSITGYHIYRNGKLITRGPVIDLAYTDGYYSGDTVTYGISAIDTLGNESPVLEVTLFNMTMGLDAGTTFRRGLIETARVLITSDQAVTIDSLEVKVGASPASTLAGPFVLTANSSYQVEKVIATTSDAPSTLAVLMTAKWSPSAGATVRITKTASADVAASGSAFEIFNDPLIRGTDAKVKLKVNNIGTAQMEFPTSENSGVTRKVSVKLKDEDGNLLSTGYLDQRVGNAIINTGPYAVARLNPGENILTEPVTLAVPSSAPYKVYIEASIDNTYYHYAKADQVVAPGIRQSAESTISETAYRSMASPEHTFYPSAQPVLITGSAISNTEVSAQNSEPLKVPFVPVKVAISVQSFDRYFTVTTDANGDFAFTFSPGVNEAGLYSVWAVHPDIKDRTVQSTFAIGGLGITPSTATIRLAKGKSVEIPVSITNYGGAQLTGLVLDTQSSSAIAAEVITPFDTVLAAGVKTGMTLRITASATAADSGFVTLTVTTSEGLSVKLEASITIVSQIPVISTSPSYIDTGMVKGNQKIAAFTIANVGEDSLRNARLEGPSTSWMTLEAERNLGDLAPGGIVNIGIMLNPGDAVTQGVYDDKIVIYSDNHIPYTYHIQVTVTSDAVGSVYFDLMNELMEKVPNATITFQHQTLLELLYTLKTGPDGSAMMNDIPEGRYSFNISPPQGITPYSGSFIITAGMTTTVPIALEMNMVTVTWSVEPTTIQDKYEIVIKQTFETNVPTPVLVVEPPNINLPDLLPGQVFNGEFKVTNYGLIEVYDVTLEFPTNIDDYDIEVFTNVMPARIGAMKSVTVPYRITRRIQTAAVTRKLCEEVQGYGGGNCVQNVQITIKSKCIICPNSPFARVVQRIANYILSKFNNCPTTITPGTPPTYTLPGGTQIYITPPPGQPTGGLIAAIPTTVTTSACPNYCNAPIVYRCFGIVDTFPHDRLCVGTNSCAGLMPAGASCPGGGMVQRSIFVENQCDKVVLPNCCDQNKFANCVSRLSSAGRCDYYCSGTYNCITWVNVVIATCQAEACSK